ncbi:YfgM family protein [Candidatus Gullanella endobia]|nr:tetratricopeptide repeat protein [Candidatus Gullanella endobia]
MIGLVINIITLIGWYYWYTNHNSISINNKHDILTLIRSARQFADHRDFSTAEKQLKKVLGQICDENLQSLVNLFLARVQLQQKNIDSTLKTLYDIKEKRWRALADNIRGDAQAIKGNQQAARIAYEKSLQSNVPQALKIILQMKINNLSN